MSKIYPFKFLDSYGKDDTKLFFGREEEINAMYEMIFQGKMLLVYGAPGTGKTSLIQCGLAGRFQSHDWLALNIRRGNDLIASFEKAIADAGGNSANEDDSIDFSALMSDEGDTVATKQLTPLEKSIKAVYLNYFRPIYLIFDQFEELFILGTKQEQRKFIEIVKELLQLDLPIKMIFSIREEYLGYLSDLEKEVPQLLRKKIRVEPMNLDKVRQVLTGVANFSGSNIRIKSGEDEAVTEGIFDKIKGKDKSLTIQLPYLQVFLDKLYLETTHDDTRQADATFSKETIDKMGDIGDVLRNFLENQVNSISAKLVAAGKPATPEVIWKILSPFATLEGTKEPIQMAELQNRLPDIDKQLVLSTVESFVNSRILRQSDDGSMFELAHDSLAKKIAGNRSAQDIVLLEVKKLISNQVSANENARELFTEKQLNFIEPNLDKLVLTEEERKLITESEKEVKVQKLRRSRRFRRTIYFFALGLIVSSGLTIWAINARSTAVDAKITALNAKRIAVEEKKAAQSLILSGQAQINLYRYGDVTAGFRFAQYAYQKDPNNIDAKRAIYTSIYQPWDQPDRYYYSVSVWQQQYVYTAFLSPDGTKILTACGDSTARIWDAATGKELVCFREHKRRVACAAFSPDGTKVVSAGNDKMARIWDAGTGKELLVLQGHTALVTCAAFSPDGSKIVTASADNTAKIWDAVTGKELRTLTGHRNMLYTAKFSPDGTRVLTRSADTTVRLWNTETGQQAAMLKGHKNMVTATVFSPDGNYIATSSWDYTAKVWDARTTALKATLQHGYFVNSVVFSPDGKKLVTSSGDKTAKVWNVSNLRATPVTLTGHTGAINAASFSKDGKKIVTASGDHTSKVWDAESGTQLATLNGHSSAVLNAYFSPGDSSIMTAAFDYSERMWKASTGKALYKVLGSVATHSMLSRSVTFAVFSPDSRKVVSVSVDSAVVWSAETYEPIMTLRGHKGAVYSAVFSRDGKKILTGSADGTAKIWDAATGAELKTLTGHTDRIYTAFFSPNGKIVATRSKDMTVRLWNAETGEILFVLDGHQREINSAIFSPDGEKLITASDDNTARIWNVATGKEVMRLTVEFGGINYAIFSHNGKKIVTAGGDNHAIIWDAEKGTELAKMIGHANSIESANFSPDDKKIVTASWDCTAKIWDVATGNEIEELYEHIGFVHSAYFSPDGKTLLTTSGDNTARIWDTETGKELATLLGNTGYVYAASFSPDGKRVFAVSDDHTSKIWLVSIPDIIGYMDKRIQDLYPDQKEKYHIYEEPIHHGLGRKP